MHSSAHPLLKKYMLQFLREVVPENQDALFSIPFRAGMLRRLQDSLKSQGAESSGTDLEVPRFDLDMDDIALKDVGAANSFNKAVQRVLFFHVVKSSPAKLIRAATEDEVGFDSDDIVIAPHRVLNVTASQRKVVVECSAMDWVCRNKKQPFILSFQAFSCEELLSIFKWQPESTLAYGIWNPPTSLNLKLPAGSAKVLPALLEGVLAEHTPLGFELDGRRSEAESWKQCLAAMENAGLVKKTHEDKRFSQWCLQEEGARVITAGYRVKSSGEGRLDAHGEGQG